MSRAKVFLDVGAHTGETLRAVADPRYRFDRIVCFEPSSRCLERLSRFRSAHVEIEPFGLWNRTERGILHDPGSVGASLFAEKARTGETQVASFVRASEWFAENLGVDDTVYLKLNCEGAECDILDDLMDSGEIRKAAFILVHFDVRKVPSQRHRENQVKARLDAVGSRWVGADEALVGPSLVARVQHWLNSVGADEYAKLAPGARIHSAVNRLRFVRAPAAFQRSRLGPLAQALLPRRVHHKLQTFFYPEQESSR